MGRSKKTLELWLLPAVFDFGGILGNVVMLHGCLGRYLGRLHMLREIDGGFVPLRLQVEPENER
jgi:hypothetical protein